METLTNFSRSSIVSQDNKIWIAYGESQLYLAHFNGSQWQTEIVDQEGDVGSDPSLAIDLLGHLHISYSDRSNGRLKYAFYDGTAWKIETADFGDKDEAVGLWSSLVLDSSGKPQISYYFEGRLKHARLVGTEWQSQTVDRNGYTGKHTSIDLDVSGHPHISYWGEADLRYAWHDGSIWHTEVVESLGTSGEAGWDTSIVVDGNGHPQISYLRFNYGDQFNSTDLRYAVNDGVSWSFETVIAAGGYLTGLNRSTSLKLDSEGHPHISHAKSYAWYDGSSWQIENFCDTLSGDSSLFLDNNGSSHISFYPGSYDAQTLYYQVKDDSGWQNTPTVIANHTSQAKYIAMAVDKNASPHILWSDESFSLKYVRSDGLKWQTETIAENSWNFSIAVDLNDHPHIVYFDADDTAVKYARHDNTVWQTQTLSDQNASAGDTSIATNSSGHPCIVYKNSIGYLVYTWFDGSQWQTSTIDQNGYDYRMKLDADGRPHVIYMKYDNGYNLHYAWYNGSVWQTILVENGIYNEYGDIALDVDIAGRPHIAFIKANNLQYTRHDGSAWHTTTVDSQNYRYMKMPSISLDPDGRPHISYYESSDAALKYAWFDGVSWNIQKLDNDGRVGNSSSVVIDKFGKPHIAYTRYDGPYYSQYNGVWSSPAKPSGLTAIAIFSQQIRLNWIDNSDNEEGFKIEYGEGDGSFKEFATVGANITSYDDIVLPGGRPCFFRVRAYNFPGSSDPSNEADITLPPGLSPAGFDSSSATLTNSYIPFGELGSFCDYAGSASLSGYSRYLKSVGKETIDNIECVKILIKGHGNHPDPDQDPESLSLFFAQDLAKNVWLFGYHWTDEEEEEEGRLDTDSAILWMPADPQVGDIFRQFDFNEYSMVTEGQVTVGQLNTGQGPFTGCLKIEETTDDGSIHIEYYAPDFGMVKEVSQGWWGDIGIWEFEREGMAGFGEISGQVVTYQDGQVKGLEKAVITLVETGQTTQSDTNGNFSIPGITEGTYTLKIEKENYTPIVLNSIVISDSQTTAISSLETTTFLEETYKFERMWPTLQQPWYFYYPRGIAIDRQDNVYVASPGVQKYNASGQFITGWKIYRQDGVTPCFPNGITTDDDGNIYVTEPTEDSVRKFNPSGQLITRWGSEGSGNGQFNHPNGLAIDNQGDVYVVDSNNYRVQKFTSSGQFITSWGEWGNGDGQFYMPNKIAIDRDGYVYVSDWSLHRIQKFSPNGAYITQWGSGGSGPGQFNRIDGLAVDDNGDVYVADNGDINDPEDTDNYRIQKFRAEEDGYGGYTYHFDMEWGSKGSGDAEFNWLRDIAIGHRGNLYAVDSGLGYEPETVESHRIQKFTLDGQFIVRWGSEGNNPGSFFGPTMVTVDGNSNVYVTEQGNDRVQKFSSEGAFLFEWGSDGSDSGQFKDPFGIVTDSIGNIYIADSGNHRIQKFNAQGVYITEFGSYGSGPGNLDTPVGLALDAFGNIYVTEWGNHRIQKFNPQGQSQAVWGSLGSGPVEFNYPSGIALDVEGNIYVSDTGDIHDAANVDNNRIQKFNPQGAYISEWGGKGTENGQFFNPAGIWIDSQSYVYVADAGNNRIQKFSMNGHFITKFGISGFNPGEFMEPYAVAVDPNNGRVYVTDYRNDRLQVFKQVDQENKDKAIIVAGGGPFPGNNLWDVTQMCANFAYRALTYQGFTKESIHYLTADTDLDLDNNGILDDVDGDVTNANLQQAITNWAKGGDNLTLYLVDHGGDSTFRMSGVQNLSVTTLDSWLDELQADLKGRVTIIYDACESGSFVRALTPPEGKERIVVTSTSPKESAYFISQGSISFSNFMWTNIFNGTTLKDAFDLSSQAMGLTTDLQHPLLDDDSDGVGNGIGDGVLSTVTYIGTGARVVGIAPVISSVSPPQTITGVNSALLFADGVTDVDGISRVWAVIKPPDYTQGADYNPVQGLPGIDLIPIGNDRYEADYKNFSISGTYYIAIYAQDRMGNTIVPVQTTVSVNTPLRHKAIIIAGAEDAQAGSEATIGNVTLAYQALLFQGYTHEDILLLSQQTIDNLSVDGPATISQFESAMTGWASDQTQDLLIYLVGAGGYKHFKINAAQQLNSQHLKQLLDDAQSTIPGKMIVVFDADESGSFLPDLTPSPAKERVLITSTAAGQKAYSLVAGAVSFSRFFWVRILNGTPLYEAFSHARRATRYVFNNQDPQVDGNGNGIGNEKTDRTSARYYTIGSGIMLAGDDPLIGEVNPNQDLQPGNQAQIWAQQVTTTGTIEQVWAVVTPPDGQGTPQIIDMKFNYTANRYEGTVTGLTIFGTYTVGVYAMDIAGNVSIPAITTINTLVGPDIYENDDTADKAGVIVINHPDVQHHSVHTAGDSDWTRFYGMSGESYEIKTENIGILSDPVIELFAADGQTHLTMDTGWLSWKCPADGFYYLRITQSDPTVSGADFHYNLRVNTPIGGLVGMLTGRVTDFYGHGIGGALLKADSLNATAVSLSNGYFLMILPSGTFTITAEVSGQPPASQSAVRINSESLVNLNYTFKVIYPGDVNRDGLVNIADVSACLQTLSGMENPELDQSGYPVSGADVNGDKKVGIEEAIQAIRLSTE